MSDSRSTPPRTEILLFEGFDDLDAVGPLEILTATGFPVRAVRFPPQPGFVTSAHGLRIELEHVLGDAPGLIVVPGGGWRDGSPVGVRPLVDGDLPGILAGLHADGTVIASVCTGAMLLSAAGLLAGRPAVTNRIALDDLERAGAEVHREARVVDDGSIVTCGGPAAGIDLSLRLVERYLGPEMAGLAVDRLEHERVGPTLITSPGRESAPSPEPAPA
jgi:transcriptional regulator GlxA family with amidase domain